MDSETKSTEPVETKPPEKKLTQAELARRLGCTPSWVSQEKAKGMPVHDYELCLAWKKEREQRTGTRSKHGATASTDPNIDPATGEAWKDEPEQEEIPDESGQEGISINGLIRTLADTKKAATAAARMLSQAQRRGQDALISARTAAHSNATKRYLETETAVRKERERRDELLSIDQHNRQMSRLWIPMLTLMRKLPRTLAPKVAMQDDVHAEKIISEEVEGVVADMRRSMKNPPDGELHFECWLLNELMKDSTGGTALDSIEKARLMVMEAVK